MNSKKYFREALSDAWDCGRNFEDEMIEQWAEGREVSDDLLNDYDSGDSYHHETHVDKDYSLTDAANLLDELAEWEETDSGLWEGVEPRRAIAAQAAYTYGNCVYDLWRRHVVNDLNERLESVVKALQDEEEDTVSAAGSRLIRVFFLLGERREELETGEELNLIESALEALEAGENTGVLVLADWYQEHNETRLEEQLREAVK